MSRRAIRSILLAAAVLAGLSPAVAQAQCSDSEQELVLAYIQCLIAAVVVGNCPELQALSERYNQEVSPSCQAAIAQTQGRAGQAMPGGSPGSIYDHGGGVYSDPGSGVSCGPSGCIGP